MGSVTSIQNYIHIMFKIVLASCLATPAAAQFIDPKDAKILKEQRFNAGDGRFSSAFAQEDGVVFREETSLDGERVGQYSYIGDDGKTITVKYTAGKDGFRILEGDHIPTGANGLNSAPFNPQHSAAPAPAPTAAPAFQPAPVTTAPIQPALQAIPDYDYADAPVDPNFNPFINPHDASHQNAGLLAGHLAGVQQPVRAPQQPIQPAINQFTFTTTTPTPRRFFPPGQLNLNRFETGFNFDFASQ